MNNNTMENNLVFISGKAVSDFTFSHEMFGEEFYVFDVEVKRLSERIDIIPVMVSEHLIDVHCDYKEMKISISGQYRSYNKHDGQKTRLILTVFARKILLGDEITEEIRDNDVFLNGYICKEPIFRKTPLGRKIADIMLAVNRPYGKTDYIPCICWGRDAQYVNGLSIGSSCVIYGRIQSRIYLKKNGNGNKEERTAYEVSAATVKSSEV